MFCSTCEPTSDGSGPTDSFVPRGTLIAISIGVNTRSATLAVPPGIFGSWDDGALVPRLGRIDRIDQQSIVIVDAQGRRATMRLSREMPPPPKRDDAVGAQEPWADRMRKIDDHTFEVERDLVRDLMSGAARPGAIRVTPVAGKDGTLAGLRFGGVAASSLPAAFGIKAGDMLDSINGTHIESVQSLLDVYARLDQLNFVKLEGTRGDKPLAIELRLR